MEEESSSSEGEVPNKIPIFKESSDKKAKTKVAPVLAQALKNLGVGDDDSSSSESDDSDSSNSTAKVKAKNKKKPAK